MIIRSLIIYLINYALKYASFYAIYEYRKISQQHHHIIVEDVAAIEDGKKIKSFTLLFFKSSYSRRTQLSSCRISILKSS